MGVPVRLGESCVGHGPVLSSLPIPGCLHPSSRCWQEDAVSEGEHLHLRAWSVSAVPHTEKSTKSAPKVVLISVFRLLCFPFSSLGIPAVTPPPSFGTSHLLFQLPKYLFGPENQAFAPLLLVQVYPLHLRASSVRGQYLAAGSGKKKKKSSEEVSFTLGLQFDLDTMYIFITGTFFWGCNFFYAMGINFFVKLCSW